MDPEVTEINSMMSAEINLTELTLLIFGIAAFVNILYWFNRKAVLGHISWAITTLATLSISGVLVLRYLNVGHAPLVTLYETFLTMICCFSVTAVIADKLTKSLIPTSVANIIAILSLAYIITWPGEDKLGSSLRPALQSPWLVIHIVTMFLSYGGLALSAGTAVIYLVTKNVKVDELSSKLINFSFPVLGLGIALGAVWAHEAWGRYWGWDPKETAALVTWFIYAAYIHVRLVLSWHPVKAAWLNLIGFVAVIFTWLGLNIVTSMIPNGSLHTYTG